METLIGTKPTIYKAIEAFKKFTSDDEMMSQYMSREKYWFDYNFTMSYEKEKGKLEGKLEIAKQMLKHKLSITQIVELTGLSKTDIENIK